MKRGIILRILALMLAVTALAGLCAPAAFADNAKSSAKTEKNTSTTAKSTYKEPETHPKITVKAGDTWEEITENFLEEYENDKISCSITLGYRNLVTGEEHFYKGDEYMVACSMYKVPLNMCFAEKIYNGEMDWDTEIGAQPYSELMRRSIVESSNEPSEHLFRLLGGYRSYRVAISEYMGVDPENVDDLYYLNNYFTAEQEIHCLKTLYEGGERFPGIIDAMLEAEPEEYFNHHEQEFDIAHKYGIMRDTMDGYKTYINDSAIVYTDEPIAIVMFTYNVYDAREALADYCTLMCDYAQLNLQKETATKTAALGSSKK